MCRSISAFSQYEKGSASLPIMKTASSDTILGEGKGTVILSILRNNTKPRKLILRNIQHVPSYPINLFGGKKLIQKEGSIRKKYIINANDKEIY